MLGLAPVAPADNVLVAYAARDGTVAADGAGRNSLTPPRSSSTSRRPGSRSISCSGTFADDVMAATKNEQQPFVYGSLSSTEIYFKAPPVGPAAGRCRGDAAARRGGDCVVVPPGDQ